MPIIAADTGGTFVAAPEGLHQAVCVDVVDKGIVETNFGPAHKVQIRWELDLVNTENGKPYMVVQDYRLSLNEKANLYKALVAWRGKKFTPEELQGFDLEKLLGANCQLQIVHNVAANGKTYGNVQAIVPPGKGATLIRGSEDYVRVVDRKPEAATATNGHHPDDDDIPF